MSSNYGYGEEPEKPSSHELANRTKKKQQIDNTSGGWRDNVNYVFNPDTVFKTIRDLKSGKNKQTRDNIKSASLQDGNNKEWIPGRIIASAFGSEAEK